MYWWVRVFEYNYERDQYDKGILLDEFYLKDIADRDRAKAEVVNKYHGETAQKITFAKPRKKDGVYAIVMDSNKFFYDRHTIQIDTFCFDCYKPIKGSAGTFPRTSLIEGLYEYDLDSADTVFFCSYECKANHHAKVRGNEGEFQEKEAGKNGDVFGYIYQIYNRATDMYYVGQTRYLPFFRWQEHIKDGGKGEISDLIFTTLAELRKDGNKSSGSNQAYLNSIEAWWIKKFQEEGKNVMNISNPKITVEELKQSYDDMVARNMQLTL